MKKFLWVLLFTILSIPSSIAMAELENFSSAQRKTTTDADWFSKSCDEIVVNPVYSGEFGIYLDHFKNTTSEKLHIRSAKTIVRGNYLLYNPSTGDDGNERFLNLNENYLRNVIDWTVNPGQTIRHMTTSEEDGKKLKYGWRFSEKFDDNSAEPNFSFWIPNYRSDGTHPDSPTNPNLDRYGPYDAEFRTITLYDYNNDINSQSDNRVIIECQKNVIRRCGDGILDPRREECDPAAAEWDSNTCDPVTCKKLPKCNSKFNGQPLLSLVESPDLCDEGTVKNFKYDDATHTWTWECEAAGTGTQCSATKPYNGGRNIDKTLISESKYVTQTGQELVWEIKVTAVNGDVKDMQIKDYLPEVLEYKSYTQNLPSGVTMEDNQPTTTGHDSTGDYLQWSTKGTLKENDSIILEVTTKVKTMPNSGDNYKNVACASPKGEPDKCDPEPVKTEGSLDINKTLTGKLYVENTGEILTWEVKVTASGDVENFEIWDVMPNKLSFVSAELIGETYGIKITKKDKTNASGAYHTVHYWDAEGILSGGNSITMQVKTKVNTMPTSGENLLNVACVVKNDKTLDCDDDKLTSPKLRIEKYFLNPDGSTTKEQKTVKVDDEIVYKIIFGNNGDAAATITSLKDFLPRNVKYVSSELFINGNKVNMGASSDTQNGDIDLDVYKGYKVVDGVYINIYGGLTLNPGDEGYIILTGKVLEENRNSTTNFACIYLDDQKIDCDAVIHNIGDIMCKSNIINSSSNHCPNEAAYLKVPVTCESDGGIADKIEIFCDGKSLNSGRKISMLTGDCEFTADGDHTVKCEVNGQTGAVSNSSCEGKYTINTKSCPEPCFPAGTKVIMADGAKKNIEDIEEGDRVLSYNTEINANEPNLVTKKLVHEDSTHEMYELTINGEVLKVTDAHRFYVRKSVGSKDYNWIEAKNLKVGNILLMSDGNLVTIEKINHYPNKQTVYNFEVKNNHNYFVDKGYLVHNQKTETPTCKILDPDKKGDLVCRASRNAYFRVACNGPENFINDIDGQDTKSREITIPYDRYKNCEEVVCYVSNSSRNGTNGNSCEREKDETPTNTDPQQCFNVNAGNFSIEEGEILPFYWNLFNMKEWVSRNENNYTEIDGDYRTAPTLLKTYEKTSCTNEKDGAIAKDSMVCTFNIYQAGKNDKPLYKVVGPCLMNEKSRPLQNNDLLNAWYEAMKKTYCDDNKKDECYFSYDDERKNNKSYLPSAVYYIEQFGSGAQISLDGKKWDLWQREYGLQYNKIEEANKSYGEYQIRLEKVEYLQCNGGSWQRIDASEAGDFKPCESNFMLTNSYTVQKTPSGNLTASTDKLSKYSNLSGTKYFNEYLNAIQATDYKPNAKVQDAMDNFIKKYEKLAVEVKTDNFGKNIKVVKKVPGKDIYFLEGDASFKPNTVSTKPFTIVQTNGDVRIEGNFSHNMMLLTKGNIKFAGNCTGDQVVKGIFYAGRKLIRAGIDKNKNSGNKFWCTNGGLHIKGVLIGDNFDGLMTASRSNLNKWFDADTDAEKRNIIMNGASVLIEYSPSIFNKSTMPPGAEDFTTALSIYKQ